MMKVFPDLAGWSFEIDEVSAGVYEVTAKDKRGPRFNRKGIDPDVLLRECHQQAKQLESEGE